MRKSTIFVVSLTTLALATGCATGPQTAASALAADTSRLNEELQALTRSRQQIEQSRSRLTDSMERTSLKIEGRNYSQLDVWNALQAKGNDYELRVKVFQAARDHSEAAAAREAQVDALDASLSSLSQQAKGEGSQHLADATKDLGSLSERRSLMDQIVFMGSYGKTIADSIDKAKQDAAAAADATSKKADAAAENATGAVMK